jgi:hypothetical protein
MNDKPCAVSAACLTKKSNQFSNRLRQIVLAAVVLLQSLWIPALAKPKIAHPSLIEHILGSILITIIVLLSVLLVIVQIWIYFIPYFIARKLENKSKRAFFLWNLFLGWTGIAWVILVWLALRTEFPGTEYRAPK